MNRFGVSWAVILALTGVLLAGCSKGPAPAPQTSSAPAQAPPPAAQAAPAAAPAQAAPAAAPAQAASPAPAPAPSSALASGEYSKDPNLRCDLMEVKRVSGGAVMVKWRLVAGGQNKPIHYFGDWGRGNPWDQIYFIDPIENKKYFILTDTGGAQIAEVFWGDLPAGEQRASWAKFPAPPGSSNKIAIHIPSFPPFEDVPVAQ